MIQRALILLLCCISHWTFAQSENRSGILVSNSMLTKVNFFFFNEFNDFTSISILPGKNEYIDTDIPIIIYVSNLNRDPFLLLPQDSVTISLVKNNQIAFTSTSSARNSELSILSKLKNATNPIFSFKESMEDQNNDALLMSDIGTRDSVVLSKFNTAKNSLDTLIINAKPSSEVSSILINYNYYSYLENRAKSLNTKAFGSQNNSKALIDTLVMLKSKLICDDCLIIDSYRRFAITYLYYLEFTISKEDIYKYITDTFEGSTRNFMLFNLMRGYANNNRIEFNKNYDNFLKDSTNSKFKDYVSKLKVDESNQVAKTFIVNLEGTKTDFEKLIASNKGKVLYIDFWASWCIPCIEELPFSKKLSESLRGKVAFIYLSLDKNKNLWLGALKSLKADTSKHFLVEGNFNSELAKKLVIKSIPRYVIIDRQGKIFAKDALRPSDGRLFEMLNKM